jgi:hypothetical protein
MEISNLNLNNLYEIKYSKVVVTKVMLYHLYSQIIFRALLVLARIMVIQSLQYVRLDSFWILNLLNTLK